MFGFSTNNVTRTITSKLLIIKQSNLTYLKLWIYHLLTVSRIALHFMTLYLQQCNWDIVWEKDVTIEINFYNNNLEQ